MPTPEAAKIAKDILDGLAGLTGEPDEIVCQASLLEQDIAEALDRFAAQRGAEAVREFIDPSDPKRCGVRPYCLTLKERDEFIVQKGLWAEFVGSLPMLGAPPQTGEEH